MAWYKDPETGEIKEVDLFEKNNSEFPSIKSLQSTMLVVPFNVPYGAPQKNLYSDTHMASANKVSQTKGFKGFAPRNIDLLDNIKAWLPWNMRKNNIEDNIIVSNYYNAVDIFAIDPQVEAENWRILHNQTKFKNNQVLSFGPPSLPTKPDPIRLKGQFSFLKEHTPKSLEYLKKDVPFSFNSYSMHFEQQFANKNSLWWKEAANGNFVNGTFQSTIEVKDSINQYSSIYCPMKKLFLIMDHREIKTILSLKLKFVYNLMITLCLQSRSQ